jgi:PAS domain-containing protein
MCPEFAELVTTPPERLADLLMLSYEPMFAWKLHGAIEFWNTGAERLYGFAPNEAVGHSCVYRKLDSTILVMQATENWV